MHYLQQASELNNRLTIPPALHWKYQHMADQSRTSIRALSDLEKKIDKEVEKIISEAEKIAQECPIVASTMVYEIHK